MLQSKACEAVSKDINHEPARRSLSLGDCYREFLPLWGLFCILLVFVGALLDSDIMFLFPLSFKEDSVGARLILFPLYH